MWSPRKHNQNCSQSVGDMENRSSYGYILWNQVIFKVWILIVPPHSPYSLSWFCTCWWVQWLWIGRTARGRSCPGASSWQSGWCCSPGDRSWDRRYRRCPATGRTGCSANCCWPSAAGGTCCRRQDCWRYPHSRRCRRSRGNHCNRDATRNLEMKILYPVARTHNVTVIRLTIQRYSSVVRRPHIACLGVDY